ncbi:MAG: hypothetical protein JWR48_201 [Mycobacterium sp.]|nr:hypothetical protein [Mycobacterium sp.]
MARFQPISRHRVTGGEVSVGVGTLPPWTGRSLVVKQSRREWLRVMRSGGVTSHCIKTSTSRRTPARHPRRLLGVGAARIDDEIYVIDGMIRGAKFGASAVSRPAKSKVAVWQRGWGRRHIATGHLSLARRQHGRANVHTLRSQRDPRAKEPESPSTAVVVEVRIDTLPLPVEGLMVPTGVVDAALIPWPLVPATLIRPHGSRLSGSTSRAGCGPSSGRRWAATAACPRSCSASLSSCWSSPDPAPTPWTRCEAVGGDADQRTR